MNKILTTLRNSLPALVAATLIATPAFAQKPDAPRPGPRPGGSRALERFDADGDGVLNDAEKEAARKYHEEQQAKLLEQYDADGDGVLSEAERAVALKDRRVAMEAKRLELFDADGDGKLNAEELEKARAARRERLGEDAPRRPRGEGEGRPPRGEKPPRGPKGPAGEGK